MSYNDLTALHSIEVRYYGQTDTQGSRIGIVSRRFKDRRIIGYDHEYENSNEQAYHWLTERGFNILGEAEVDGGYAFISDTFKSLYE